MSTISSPFFTHTRQRPLAVRPSIKPLKYDNVLKQIPSRGDSAQATCVLTGCDKPLPEIRPASSGPSSAQDSNLSPPPNPFLFGDDCQMYRKSILAPQPVRLINFGETVQWERRSRWRFSDQSAGEEKPIVGTVVEVMAPVGKTKTAPSPRMDMFVRYIPMSNKPKGIDTSTLKWPPTPPAEEYLHSQNCISAHVQPVSHLQEQDEIVSSPEDLFGFNRDWTAKSNSRRGPTSYHNTQQAVLSELSPNISITRQAAVNALYNIEHSSTRILLPGKYCGTNGTIGQKIRSKARSVARRPGVVIANTTRKGGKALRSHSATETEIDADVNAITSKSEGLTMEETEYELLSEDDDDLWY